MRHSIGAARNYLFGCLFAAVSTTALSADIGVTVDLISPQQNCVGSQCATDIVLPDLGTQISSSGVTMNGTSSTITLDNTQAVPITCSEVSTGGSPYTYGPTANKYQVAIVYSNPAGGEFAFDAGATSNFVDDSVSNDGTLMAASQVNSTSKQVACYPINHVGDTTPLLADSSLQGDRVFNSPFEVSHFANEPWVSVNSILSPATGLNQLGFVAQIHNATSAVNWHFSFGFDKSFFNAPSWCILTTAHNPQPGPVNANTESTCGAASSTHTITSADIQAASNSIYVYVQNPNNTSSNHLAWSTVNNTFYAASAAVFAPPGTYVQRVDDKVSAVGPNNVPIQNIGNIVCANDPLATACTITDADGANIPASITFKNQFSAGVITVDPLAYVVDSAAGTTLPGSTALAAPSGVSCDDPSGILLSVDATNFGTSVGAAGARSFNVGFNTAGTLFVPGTASCSATFTANGLSSVQTFNITMQQVNVTHFDVAADSTATAGGTVNFTVTAKDGAGNAVPTYSGTVGFTSSDPIAALPTSTPLTLGTGNFTATLKKAGAQTITATDSSASTIKGTSNNVTVSAAAAASFAVDVSGPVPAGSATVMHVNPHDVFDNLVSGYTGTVHFTSTDNGAMLPLDAAFTNGFYNGVTFNTPGTQTVTATDANDGSITGTSNGVNVSP